MPAIYLDSCTFVIAFEMTGPMVNPARRLIEALKDRPGSAVTSELTIAELLAPAKAAQVMSVAERRRLYIPILDEGFIQLAPITRAILDGTVTLREEVAQRIPDAIHMATAAELGCRLFVSFDRDARRLPRGVAWVSPTDESVDEMLVALDA